jgi:ParB family chromosome partitioning protein
MAEDKNKTLKRGLSALLGEEASSSGEIQNASFSRIDKISPSRFQARTDISTENLEDLAASIRSQGVIQPLIVRKTASGEFELVAGERRLRAAKMVGLSEVPIVVKDLRDEEIIKMGLIENLQREDLNPLDEAKGISRLQKEFDLTQEDLGISLGKSRTAITNSLRLLQLATSVQAMLESGSLNMGHARPLLTLPEAIQEKFAHKIVKAGLSTRQAENLAKTYQQEKDTKPLSSKDPNIVNLEAELSDILSSKVTISHQKKGSGKITFTYKNLEQLDQIIKPFRKKE